MQDLQLALTRDSKSEIRSGPNDTLIVERTRIKGWVIVVCIILFPIGLLALLASKEIDRGTIAVSDNGDGLVLMRMSGTFFKASHAAINDVIVRGSLPSA